MIHAAIIGCGSVAPVHAHALKQLSNVELVACADTNIERAQRMAGEYNIRAYASMEELLASEQVQVVHLCTPHYLHTPMAEAAAARGIHVFTEKPPVISREQWARLKKASDAVRVGVCFQNRYNEGVVQMKKLLGEGSLGKALGARAFVTWTRDRGYYENSGWRGQLATEGGGALINQAIHTLDLMVYLMGKPSNVESSLSNHHLKGIIQVEDALEVYMTFEQAPGLFYATTAYCMNSPVLLEIACENGTLRLEGQALSLLWKDGRIQRLEYEAPLNVAKDYWGGSHITCIADFYDALEAGRETPLGLDKIKDTIETLFAIYHL
jgi:predicted dehydrogenase